MIISLLYRELIEFTAEIVAPSDRPNNAVEHQRFCLSKPIGKNQGLGRVSLAIPLLATIVGPEPKAATLAGVIQTHGRSLFTTSAQINNFPALLKGRDPLTGGRPGGGGATKKPGAITRPAELTMNDANNKYPLNLGSGNP